MVSRSAPSRGGCLISGLDLTRLVSIEQVSLSHTYFSFQLSIHAGEFDHVFGPILMITYACLSNTLLLTGTWSFYYNVFEVSHAVTQCLFL